MNSESNSRNISLSQEKIEEFLSSSEKYDLISLEGVIKLNSPDELNKFSLNFNFYKMNYFTFYY